MLSVLFVFSWAWLGFDGDDVTVCWPTHVELRKDSLIMEWACFVIHKQASCVLTTLLVSCDQSNMLILFESAPFSVFATR